MGKNHFLFFGIILIVILTIISLKETDGLQKLFIPFLDKALHLLAYIILTILWSSYLILHKPSVKLNKNLTLIFIGLMLYGIIIEVLQSKWTVTRLMEFNDLIANFFGIIIGILIFKYIFRYKLKNK